MWSCCDAIRRTTRRRWPASWNSTWRRGCRRTMRQVRRLRRQLPATEGAAGGRAALRGAGARGAAGDGDGRLPRFAQNIFPRILQRRLKGQRSKSVRASACIIPNVILRSCTAAESPCYQHPCGGGEAEALQWLLLSDVLLPGARAAASRTDWPAALECSGLLFVARSDDPECFALDRTPSHRNPTLAGAPAGALEDGGGRPQEGVQAAKGREGGFGCSGGAV